MPAPLRGNTRQDAKYYASGFDLEVPLDELIRDEYIYIFLMHDQRTMTRCARIHVHMKVSLLSEHCTPEMRSCCEMTLNPSGTRSSKIYFLESAF